MAIELVLPRLPRYARTAYRPPAPRIRELLATQPISASRRGWGPGWPDCQTAKLVRVEANRINGTRYREEAAELFRYLQLASNALGYDLRKVAEPDGGVGSWSCRAIKNSRPPAASNHSWGLAIDQNTKSNPMSKTWHSTTPPDVVYLFESAGCRWGGRFDNVRWFYDPMHFEYMGTPDSVAADLVRAKLAFRQLTGGFSLYPNLHTGATNRAMVRVAQYRLTVHGLVVVQHGTFDAPTLDTVRNFQASCGLVVDGWIGPKTWEALNAQPGVVIPPTEDPAVIAELRRQLEATNAKLADALDQQAQDQAALAAAQETMALDIADAQAIELRAAAIVVRNTAGPDA